jgi:3-hydroxyacyl-CoA dehydrogenase
MEVIDTLYTVTLRDCPDEVPERIRTMAEARYAKALENALGGPEQVAAALDTMADLETADAEEISQADLALAARWAKACNAARQAGFRDLGEAEGMYFEVRIS